MPRVFPGSLTNAARRLVCAEHQRVRRKLFASALTLVVAIGFAGCGGGSRLAKVRASSGSSPASMAKSQSSAGLTPTATVAGDQRRFTVRRTSSGAIIVSDPAHGLTATLSAARIVVRGRHGLRVGLSRPAIGREATLVPVSGFAVATLKHNRATFCCSDLDEWYARSRLGIEQGFTIAARLTGFGPLEIAQTISVTRPPAWRPAGEACVSAPSGDWGTRTWSSSTPPARNPCKHATGRSSSDHHDQRRARRLPPAHRPNHQLGGVRPNHQWDASYGPRYA